MTVPFDWPPQWPPQWPEIESALQAAIASGDWASYFSHAHETLTHRLAEKFGVKFVRLCCSGTAAIEMALRAAQVVAGDEVITAAWDYPGNLRCIEALGATPVLVDVAPQGTRMNLDQLDELARASDSRVRAVVVSHLYGHAADVAAIRQICDQRGWVLIEDACQVPGMQIETGQGPRLAGSFGHVAALSFGGSKPLTAGNGGAVLTSDEKTHARLKRLYDRPSDTLPLSALQAAVLAPQLDRLDELNRMRCATVKTLETYLRERLPSWQPLEFQADITHSSFYKYAFLAASSEHRARILRDASLQEVPMGEGFRSLDRVSAARCRKPFPLDSAREMGARCCVLDHRALMIPPEHHRELCARLQRIQTNST